MAKPRSQHSIATLLLKAHRMAFETLKHTSMSSQVCLYTCLRDSPSRLSEKHCLSHGSVGCHKRVDKALTGTLSYSAAGLTCPMVALTTPKLNPRSGQLLTGPTSANCFSQRDCHEHWATSLPEQMQMQSAAPAVDRHLRKSAVHCQ